MQVVQVINSKKLLVMFSVLLVANALYFLSPKPFAENLEITENAEIKITLMTAITMLRSEMPEGYKIAKILGLNVDKYGANSKWSLVGCHANGDWLKFDVDSENIKREKFAMRLKSLDCASAPDLMNQHLADSPGVMEVLEAARERAGLTSDGLASLITTDLVILDGRPQHIWRISGKESSNYVAKLGGSSFRVDDIEVQTCDQLEAVYNIKLTGCNS
jgi:hypothetical protein